MLAGVIRLVAQRLIALFRTLYYLPAIMPAVASAVLFRWVFQQQGILNYLMGGFGRVDWQRMPNWLHLPAQVTRVHSDN